jgi:hypothetical protein
MPVAAMESARIVYPSLTAAEAFDRPAAQIIGLARHARRTFIGPRNLDQAGQFGDWAHV